MLLQRMPSPPLRPFVRFLWASETVENPRSPRELSLPTGVADIVFRLAGGPVRVFESGSDPRGTTFPCEVLSGARSRSFVRDVSCPSVAVGAHLQPTGVASLLGIPARELAGTHSALADLWGRDAALLRERLLEAASPAARLDVLEDLLLARLTPQPVHPAVAHLLERLDRTRGRAAVRELVRETGWGQRWVGEAFRREVGLAPKAYARIQRFQHALDLAARGAAGGWSAIAHGAGYCDASHLVREFRALAGIAPGSYVPLSSERRNHVPIVARSSISSKPRSRAAGYNPAPDPGADP